MGASDIQAVLLIGGLDPQGCAGITVDQYLVHAHDLHPVPLVTCLTQQTQAGLTQMGAVPAEQFMRLYHCAVADFEIVAIKIGLLPNVEIAQCVKQIVTRHTVPVVLDPVAFASSGGQEMAPELVDYLSTQLLPDVSLITPNLAELARLVPHEKDRTMAGKALLSQGAAACLIKGGHTQGQWAVDEYLDSSDHFYVVHEKQPYSVRGTGCALASSMTCYLAKGESVKDAIILAKSQVYRAIRQSRQLGPYRVLRNTCSLITLRDLPKLYYQPALIGRRFAFPRCPKRLGIYPVVDSAEWVDKILREGIQTVQLRIKQADPVQCREEIARAVRISRAYPDSALFINDYWQLAIEAGAYGVHLGQEDLDTADLAQIQTAGLRLGVSTHSYWELARALSVNPSYIALGPVFETSSKRMSFSPQGVDKVRDWQQILADSYPLVAIGGIKPEHAAQLKQTGVGAIAMISAITQAEDYRAVLHELQSIWSE